MAPDHIMETASIKHYQPHTGTAVLLHGHLSIYPYRCDIHAQQGMNARISPVLHAEHFLMHAVPKARLLHVVRKRSDHTNDMMLMQKFRKLVDFRKYLFENCID